jgi:hypothetical protein
MDGLVFYKKESGIPKWLMPYFQVKCHIRKLCQITKYDFNKQLVPFLFEK